MILLCEALGFVGYFGERTPHIISYICLQQAKITIICFFILLGDWQVHGGINAWQIWCWLSVIL
jgi:hypothetical protein